MKVVVTGVGGQLGFDVIKVLEERNIPCKGVDVADFDITDYQGTREAILNYHPDAVIHCSAYTAVDRAEEEAEICKYVNETGAENVAKACQEIDAKLVYISTDYVFPGDGENFYETSDQKGPQNVYGETKLAGEAAVQKLVKNLFIVRISWVFGKNGNNFVKTMLRLGKERESITVVSDQIGSPTYTADLAPLLCDMIATEKYGIYHATNEGLCSWAEFAQEIMKLSGLKTAVIGITTNEYKTSARRPLNSRLSKESLDQAGFSRLPHWKDALERYLKEIK